MAKKVRTADPILNGVINPFSEAFLPVWQMWKDYKIQEFRFKYKGCLSEQAALMHLNTLSKSKEDIATAIIKQSMENGWKGLFELKNNTNGTGTHQQTFTGNNKPGTSEARIGAVKNLR